MSNVVPDGTNESTPLKPHDSAPSAEGRPTSSSASGVLCTHQRLALVAADGRGPRRVNTWRFAVLAYFLVCGGPFGIEIAVSAGGPLLTLFGFLVMPILWSMPQVRSLCGGVRSRIASRNVVIGTVVRFSGPARRL